MQGQGNAGHHDDGGDNVDERQRREAARNRRLRRAYDPLRQDPDDADEYPADAVAMGYLPDLDGRRWREKRMRLSRFIQFVDGPAVDEEDIDHDVARAMDLDFTGEIQYQRHLRGGDARDCTGSFRAARPPPPPGQLLPRPGVGGDHAGQPPPADPPSSEPGDDVGSGVEGQLSKSRSTIRQWYPSNGAPPGPRQAQQQPPPPLTPHHPQPPQPPQPAQYQAQQPAPEPTLEQQQQIAQQRREREIAEAHQQLQQQEADPRHQEQRQQHRQWIRERMQQQQQRIAERLARTGRRPSRTRPVRPPNQPSQPASQPAQPVNTPATPPATLPTQPASNQLSGQNEPYPTQQPENISLVAANQGGLSGPGVSSTTRPPRFDWPATSSPFRTSNIRAYSSSEESEDELSAGGPDTFWRPQLGGRRRDTVTPGTTSSAGVVQGNTNTLTTTGTTPAAPLRRPAETTQGQDDPNKRPRLSGSGTGSRGGGGNAVTPLTEVTQPGGGGQVLDMQDNDKNRPYKRGEEPWFKDDLYQNLILGLGLEDDPDPEDGYDAKPNNPVGNGGATPAAAAGGQVLDRWNNDEGRPYKRGEEPWFKDDLYQNLILGLDLEDDPDPKDDYDAQPNNPVGNGGATPSAVVTPSAGWTHAAGLTPMSGVKPATNPYEPYKATDEMDIELIEVHSSDAEDDYDDQEPYPVDNGGNTAAASVNPFARATPATGAPVYQTPDDPDADLEEDSEGDEIASISANVGQTPAGIGKSPFFFFFFFSPLPPTAPPLSPVFPH
ncbi:hypothetical protein diail_4802 [Diaporthe ilicicola]|nr:hypothetical protein diail_4802 [Diaporthe ilicicola]